MLQSALCIAYAEDVGHTARVLAEALDLRAEERGPLEAVLLNDGNAVLIYVVRRDGNEPTSTIIHLSTDTAVLTAKAAFAIAHGASFLRAARRRDGDGPIFVELLMPGGEVRVRLLDAQVLTSLGAAAVISSGLSEPMSEAELFPPLPLAAPQTPNGTLRSTVKNITVRAPVFPSLEVSVMDEKGLEMSATPNSRKGIPIDSAFFQGEALLLLRTDPLDPPYVTIFEGKQRQFEIQVQGKFKKVPQGDLYITIEITDKMKLGLVTKGMCKVLLGFAQRLNRYMHYSFGDDQNAELPHISFPLVTSVDTLVVTLPGETPPLLGQRFPEDREDRRKRTATAGFGEFQVGPVYSFSFHSMYIDIPRWSTRRIPMLRDMDLHAFWGDSAMRIAAYMAPSELSNKPHYQSAIEYIMCIQVRHDPAAPTDAADGLEEVETVETVAVNPSTLATLQRQALSGTLAANGLPPEQMGRASAAAAAAAGAAGGGDSDRGGLAGEDDGSDSDGGSNGSDEDDSERYSDARSTLDEPFALSSAAGNGASDSAGAREDARPGGATAAAAATTAAAAAPTSRDGSSSADESDEDVARVPAYLELYERPLPARRGSADNSRGSSSSSSKTNAAAAAVASVLTKPSPPVYFVVVHKGRVALRRGKEMERSLPVQLAPPPAQFSARLSAREVQRRRFSTVLQLISTVHRHQNERLLDDFMTANTPADRDFAAGSEKNSSAAPTDRADDVAVSPSGSATSGGGGGGLKGKICKQATAPLREGLVVRALSEHHWREELAVLTPSALTLHRGKKTDARVPCSDVVGVVLCEASLPFSFANTAKNTRKNALQQCSGSFSVLPGYSLIEIHTVGRVHYLMVVSSTAREWAAALRRLMPSSGIDRISSSNAAGAVWRLSEDFDAADSGDNGGLIRPYEEYLARKGCWKGHSRWVMNCRRLNVGGGGSAATTFCAGNTHLSSRNAGENPVGNNNNNSSSEAYSFSLAAGADLTNSGGAGAGSLGFVGLGFGDGGGDAWGTGPTEKAEELVAALLRQGLALSAEEGGSSGSAAAAAGAAARASDLVSFLDGTTRLRMLSLEGLTHNEQMALFLNLYHLMIVHASLVVGPPSSPLRWNGYFNHLSYEVGGDVLSLAELEHCVIRARMHPPRQFLSKFALPTGEYSFALRRPDARINFVLNSGTAGGVPGVAVYASAELEAQLAAMSAHFLRHTVEVNAAKRVARLPKLLQWYAADFGDSGAPVDVLRAVAHNAGGQTRETLAAMLSQQDGGVVTVSYRAFVWQCRSISLVDPSEIAGASGSG